MDNREYMPHIRKRFLQEITRKVLSFSPLVGILGHRQVGKTTLLLQISNHYTTLDDQKTLNKVTENPKKFLKTLLHLKSIIDESQLAPGLFPALKERVRVDRRPGQFLLSGSVRFTSRKAIRESLTGRIVNLELVPLTISEIQHLSLPDIALQILASKDLSGYMERNTALFNQSRILNKEVDLYFKRGGLPGICFIRDERIRSLKIGEQLSTILDRDLRLVYSTTLPYSQILDYVRALSIAEGTPVRFQQLEKQVKISEATQKKLLYALEAVFMIRMLPIEGGRKGHIVYLEDQAEALYLSGRRAIDPTTFEGLIFRNLRAQWAYRLGEKFRFFHYLTRGGARVPICIQTVNGVLGVIPIKEELPTRSDLMTAGSFLKNYVDAKILFIALKTTPKLIDSRSLLLPVSSIV